MNKEIEKYVKIIKSLNLKDEELILLIIKRVFLKGVSFGKERENFIKGVKEVLIGEF